MIMPTGKVRNLTCAQVYSYDIRDGVTAFKKMDGLLSIFRKISPVAQPSDLAVVLGYEKKYGYFLDDMPEPDMGYKKRDINDSYGYTLCNKRDINFFNVEYGYNVGLRPVIPYDKELIMMGDLHFDSTIPYVEYGEYPQTVVPLYYAESLEERFKHKQLSLNPTGKKYHIMTKAGLTDFEEYKDALTGYKYIRIISSAHSSAYELSEGTFEPNQPVWIRVDPIKWYIDEKAGLLVSEKSLLTGEVCYWHGQGIYKRHTEEYLNDHFSQDIKPIKKSPEIKEQVSDTSKEEKKVTEKTKKGYQFKKVNPFGFKLEEKTPEQTIESAMRAGVAVFLHGKSSDGKSARVKQIDPDCEIVYLRNATPESLNGKSVYNAKTGEMKDIKPTWLVRLEEKCAKEPDKLHILFLDEIANALPSIQGIAFNIVLDREVNGRWKLPENARIVAAGNEITDSLAAQPIAEPLFNRFAHVYIKTTTESWLRWASDMDIHPAIYAYIAYKNGEVLRTEYTGDKPNADPRKWEMASKMLYATNNPESIVSLVGEEITKEFIEFCKREVLTLEDVLNDNYDDKKIESLDTSERYATIIGLTQVDNKDVEKVIKFTKILGAEYEAVFESMWAANDEARLEIIAEIKMADGSFSI